MCWKMPRKSWMSWEPAYEIHLETSGFSIRKRDLIGKLGRMLLWFRVRVENVLKFMCSVKPLSICKIHSIYFKIECFASNENQIFSQGFSCFRKERNLWGTLFVEGSVALFWNIVIVLLRIVRASESFRLDSLFFFLSEVKKVDQEMTLWQENRIASDRPRPIIIVNGSISPQFPSHKTSIQASLNGN